MKSEANKKSRPGLKFILFNRKGRLSRKFYWAGLGISIAILYLLAMIWGLLVPLLMAYYKIPHHPNEDRVGEIFMFGQIMTQTAPGLLLSFFILLVLLLFFWSLFTVSSKRLHDLGWSGWWLSMPFIPLLPMMVFTITYETQLPVVLFTISLLAAVVLFIAAGLVKGPPAANKYGPSPLTPLTDPTDETI